VAAGVLSAGASGEQAEPATCGGMSFTANTKVLVASGAAVPISALKVGEKVLATNTKTGKTTAETVAAVLVHYDTNRYDLRVRTARGPAVIGTTRSHLFWDQDTNRWVKAAALKHGTHLRVPGRGTVTVADGHAPRNATGWMWDLTVPGDHDFYVQATTTAILVHNDDCGTAPKGRPYIWKPFRPGVDNTPQGSLPADAPFVKPGTDLVPGEYHYVVMRDGTMRAIQDDAMWALNPNAGHTSLAGGEPVNMAGTFDVNEAGAISRFDNFSGHYQPTEMPGYAPLEGIARSAFASNGLPAPLEGSWDYWYPRGG
jgi:hypothetical protein